MANVSPQIRIEYSVTLILTEQEARLLHEISCYDHKAVIKALKQGLGTHYIEPHAPALEPLFKSFKSMGSQLDMIKKMRKSIRDALHGQQKEGVA